MSFWHKQTRPHTNYVRFFPCMPTYGSLLKWLWSGVRNSGLYICHSSVGSLSLPIYYWFSFTVKYSYSCLPQGWDRNNSRGKKYIYFHFLIHFDFNPGIQYVSIFNWIEFSLKLRIFGHHHPVQDSNLKLTTLIFLLWLRLWLYCHYILSYL